MSTVAEAPPGIQGTALSELVTVGITTFLRPQALLRLRASIRRFYPDLPVVVVDTASNLSQGRNRLARAVATPLLLLCEDDFEFCEQTRIEPLVAVLAHDAEIAGIGGDVLESRGRACWAHNYHHQGHAIDASPSSDPPRRTPGGVVYQPCQLILNFGLFRRELFRQVPWDEDIPLNEHVEYYWRVSQCSGWKVAVARGIAILHHKDRPSDEYSRWRGRRFWELVDAKHGAPFRTEGVYVWSDDAATGG
jgi:hypothetical protein